MRSGERVALFFVRPIYRTFFERPIWWFLARMKTFFLSEIGVQLGNFERRFLLEDEVNDQRWGALEERLRIIESKSVVAIEERLQRAEATNAAQWDAIEQLLLALFRQPATHTAIESRNSQSLDTANGNGTGPDLNRAHAANHIR